MPYSELKFMQWVTNASQYTRLRCRLVISLVYSLSCQNFALLSASCIAAFAKDLSSLMVTESCEVATRSPGGNSRNRKGNFLSCLIFPSCDASMSVLTVVSLHTLRLPTKQQTICVNSGTSIHY